MKRIHYSIPALGRRPLRRPESARTGEAQVALNLRERDCSLEVCGTPVTVGEVISGERIVATLGSASIVTLRDSSVLCLDGQPFHTLAAGQTFCDACPAGNFLVVATSGGRLFFRPSGSTLQRLYPLDALPSLHFDAVDRRDFLSPIGDMEFANGGYTRWQVPLRGDDLLQLAAMSRAAMRRARADARAGGYLFGPVLAACAVRLFDDTLLWASQPVLVGHDATLQPNYRVAAEVTTDSSRFTGIESVNATVTAYRLGISVLKGIGSEWQGLVKAVDILVSDPVDPVALNASLDYRCGISNVGNEHRYILEFGLPAQDKKALGAQLLASGKWHRLCSTAAPHRLVAGGAFPAVPTAQAAVQPLAGYICTAVVSTPESDGGMTVDSDRFRHAVANLSLCPQGGKAMAHNGRLYAAPQSMELVPAWHFCEAFRGVESSVPCSVDIAVELATDEGTRVVRTSFTAPYTPAAINPLISFPHEQATALTANVGGKNLAVQLSAAPALAAATHLTALMDDQALSSGNVTLPAHTGCSFNRQGSVAVSHADNPMVTQWTAKVSGLDILHLAAVGRPVYSGGFGRYPIYLFTTQGVFALPQSTGGVFGEPRLIARTVIDSQVAPCADTLGRVWLVSALGQLYRLDGGKLATAWHNAPGIKRLAWAEREKELWILLSDGTLLAMMPSGRLTQRSLEATDLFCNEQRCFAISTAANGSAAAPLLNLNEENADAQQTMEYLSHPFTLKGQPAELTWDIAATTPQLLLTLRGERGHSCHGFIINSLNARGTIAAPIHTKIVAQPANKLRLHIQGTLPAGTIIHPTEIAAE